MESVFDLHIHYTFEIPLRETVDIFEQEFAHTDTKKGCFLSLPHHAKGDGVLFDSMQNLKGLYLKRAFSPNAYAFAGLEHPESHHNENGAAESFLSQAKKYMAVGFDGIKMLEGYPSLIKNWGLPIDSDVYNSFYAFMEENGYPILMHAANPTENWDLATASADAVQAGRVYDSSYPTKAEILAQVFRVMERFPRLTLILAHFGFMSDDLPMAQKFMAYPNTWLDTTPGGEQCIRMQTEWGRWLPFWQKYQDRILYGTDFYAFPKDERWEESFMRRPKFLRQFLETDTQHRYLDGEFFGVKLDKRLRDKIYRENFMRLLGLPKAIDEGYIRRKAERLSNASVAKTTIQSDDLAYILSNLSKR